jgi:hypothetical protein
MEEWIYSPTPILHLSTRWRWRVNFSSLGKEPPVPIDRRLGMTHSHSGCCGEEKISCWICVYHCAGYEQISFGYNAISPLKVTWYFLWPWRTRWHVPLTRQLTFNALHGVISQKTQLFRNPCQESNPLSPAIQPVSRNCTEWATPGSYDMMCSYKIYGPERNDNNLNNEEWD